jgi:L-fuculose-phosphate aldolase
MAGETLMSVMETGMLQAAGEAWPIAELNLLAKTSRILEVNGHGDRIYGHIAMRDAEGRGFWIKRSGISLGEVFDHRDFLLASFDGELLHGEGKLHSEWPIHAEILKRRPDIVYTGHTHPFYSVVYSSIKEPLPLLHKRRFASPPRYEESSEFILTPQEGAAVAAAMGQSMIVMLRHHGIVFCGKDRVEFLYNGIGLEEACHEAVVAAGSGLSWSVPPAGERKVERRSASSGVLRDNALWAFYCRMVERAERAGDIRLSTAHVDQDGR